jgi:putative membrane protein
MMQPETRHGRCVLKGLAAGIVAGLIASGIMSAVHHVLAPMFSEEQPPSAEKRGREAQQEDATVKVASAATRLIVGRELPERWKPLAGSVVHYGFGATVAGTYGALAEVLPRVTIGRGLFFGVAVWLGAHVVTVPALGLSPSPLARPIWTELLEFVAHLVYGTTAELVRGLLRRRS